MKSVFHGKKPEQLLENFTDNEDYKSLALILTLAHARASLGKGKERHAEDKPFTEQDIVRELRDLGISGGIYQIRKKAKELLGMDNPAAAREALDIIVYAAAVIIVLMEKDGIDV